MSIFEDSFLSAETPAILAHSTKTQVDTTNRMGAAAFGIEEITLTRRRYATK